MPEITHEQVNTARDALLKHIEGKAEHFIKNVPADQRIVRLLGAFEAAAVLAETLEEEARRVGLDPNTIHTTKERIQAFLSVRMGRRRERDEPRIVLAPNMPGIRTDERTEPR